MKEEELSVICIKVVVERKEEMRVLRGVVYMMKSKGFMPLLTHHLLLH